MTLIKLQSQENFVSINYLDSHLKECSKRDLIELVKDLITEIKKMKSFLFLNDSHLKKCSKRDLIELFKDLKSFENKIREYGN